MMRKNIDIIPVFVFHKENPSYLRHTIVNEVHLLSDETKISVENLE
jgi:hypothetical protein